MLEISVFL